MNPATATHLEDVQSRPDGRGVALDRVGVSDLRVPIQVTGRDGAVQPTIATAELAVALPAHVKGTHMSRFVEALHAVDGAFDPHALHALASSIRDRLAADEASIAMTFPYFIWREAPVSGLTAPLDFEGMLSIVLNGSCAFRVGVRAPIASLCPCSKEISDYGAHNQRGYVDVTVGCSVSESLWIEDLIDIAERAASAPVYPLLKRVDERQVTMAAYENPAFVEDIARDIVVALRRDRRVQSYSVRVTNLESIHSHNAMAVVEGGIESHAD
jgi:GTP cyclohydrolase I